MANPSRWPPCAREYSLASATIPAISGAEALVPPDNIHPWRKQSPAVQWTMYPRRPAVAFSETSGTSRQTPADRWQGTPLE